MDIITLLILILATWRITVLLVNEDGPFDILAKFRNWIDIYYDEFSNSHAESVIGQVFICTWCLSIWIGLFYTLIWLFLPVIIFYLLALPFALSTGVIFMEWIRDNG